MKKRNSALLMRRPSVFKPTLMVHKLLIFVAVICLALCLALCVCSCGTQDTVGDAPVVADGKLDTDGSGRKADGSGRTADGGGITADGGGQALGGGALTADSGDPDYESRVITIDGLPGDPVQISIAELRMLNQYELDASYQRTTGMIESFHMKGPYLREVLGSLGVDLLDYAGVGVVGADAYYCMVSREVIEATPDLMLALTIDGEARLDEDVAPAQLAVQGQFGPYWVKMVERIVLYDKVPEKEISSVWAFDSLTEGIEPYMYEYYGSQDASIELAQIFSRFDYVDSRAFFTMNSSDGFKKNEVINMVKARYYIKYVGEDSPTNISPYIKLGMNVQHISWFSTNADAVIFLNEMSKYMDTADIGGQIGLPISEVLYEVGVETLRGRSWQVIGAEGERVTATGENLSKGILAPGPDGSVRVLWEPECGYEDINRLLRIRRLDESTAQVDSNAEATAATSAPGADAASVHDAAATAPDAAASAPDAAASIPAAVSATANAVSAPAAAATAPDAATSASDYSKPSAETILTISGDGVERTVYFTLDDLKQISSGYTEAVYSTLNNWPTRDFIVAKGVDIRSLFALAGLKPRAKSVRAESSDGYYASFTIEQLTGPLFCYPISNSGGSIDATGATGATSASSATSATNATGATSATNAAGVTSATNAAGATSANSATGAASANSATGATGATSASNAAGATSATNAAGAVVAASASSATNMTGAPDSSNMSNMSNMSNTSGLSDMPGVTQVNTIVSWAFRSGTTDVSQAREDDLRLVLGQDGVHCVNTAAMVKQLTAITISADKAGSWPTPTLSVHDGQLTIEHESMDLVKIHYTLDGSAPTVNSPVYNPSTSYFQPQLIQPIAVKSGMKVNAFAAGYGRNTSETVSINVN
ncbi:MAG: molybdopterin-dependent oxidoreductase [Oscillospiraceae bacterium]|nr:molybdopterin-dependent oxidoreductase [Oscillospiraceae bacterium]